MDYQTVLTVIAIAIILLCVFMLGRKTTSVDEPQLSVPMETVSEAVKQSPDRYEEKECKKANLDQNRFARWKITYHDNTVRTRLGYLRDFMAGAKTYHEIK